MIQANKELFQGHSQKLVHMYLPSSNNPKFANRLLISKMSTPTTMNISFTQNPSPTCLHSKDNARESKHKSTKDALALSIKQKNTPLTGIDLILSARYNRDKIDNQERIQTPLTLRESTKKEIKQKTIIDRWRSINLTFKEKEKEKQRQNRMRASLFNQDVQREVRTSISRMLQQTKDKASFEYITKFYKKPIEREIAVRKTKKESKNFSQILNVCQFKPSSQSKNKNHRSVEPRCRCHKNSPLRNSFRMSNTSHITKRPRQFESISLQNKPQTSNSGHRKILTLNIPQNWVVDSWQTQSKNLQEGASLTYQKCEFHD